MNAIPPHSSFGKARLSRASGVRLPVREPLARPRPNSGSRRTHRGLTSQRLTLSTAQLRQQTAATRVHSHRCPVLSLQAPGKKSCHASPDRREPAAEWLALAPNPPLPHVFPGAEGMIWKLLRCHLTDWALDPTCTTTVNRARVSHISAPQRIEYAPLQK